MTAPRAMHIGEMAERAEMSVRTIRHYDDIGLLQPTGRTEGGFRLYSEGDLERLLVIRRMKPLGYSLEQSADLLRIVDTIEATGAGDETRSELLELMDDARSRRARLAQHVEWADEFIEILRRRLPAGTLKAGERDAEGGASATAP